MNDAYTKFMLQQDMTINADSVFYEKLEKGSAKKRMPVWKAAVVAACICLIVSGCVWAAETMFGVTNVTVSERPVPINDLPHVGLDIVYENIEHYSLKEFPKHLQELEEGGIVLHDDWAAAEEYLGIDLIDNPLFTAEDTYRVAGFGEKDKYCQGIYYVWDNFYGAKIGSVFKRNGLSYFVGAMITADAPVEIAEEVTKYYHGTSISYAKYPNRDVTVSTEDYVTASGIPVLIATVTGHPEKGNKKWDDLLDCFACFAVNNISYTVSINGYSFASTELDTYSGPKEKATIALKDFLDGFVIE